MSVKFRNITASPSAPVSTWGVEGLLSAVERGGINEWVRIVRAVRADPQGQVVAELVEALDEADAPGAVALLRRELARAQDPDRAAVVRRLRRAWRSSGMTHAELAAAAGTSRARITSYLSGSQAPTALVAARIERVAANSSR